MKKSKLRIYMGALWEEMIEEGSLITGKDGIIPSTPTSYEYTYIVFDLLGGMDSKEVWLKIKKGEYLV